MSENDDSDFKIDDVIDSLVERSASGFMGGNFSDEEIVAELTRLADLSNEIGLQVARGKRLSRDVRNGVGTVAVQSYQHLRNLLGS